ncbi:MAG: hypothetical protein WBM47_04295, partial [Polyangiales bacterium]
MSAEGSFDRLGPLPLGKALGRLGEFCAKAGRELMGELPLELGPRGRHVAELDCPFGLERLCV